MGIHRAIRIAAVASVAAVLVPPMAAAAEQGPEVEGEHGPEHESCTSDGFDGTQSRPIKHHKGESALPSRSVRRPLCP